MTLWRFRNGSRLYDDTSPNRIEDMEYIFEQEGVFDWYLDWAYGDVEIMEYAYPTSEVLKVFDPALYDSIYADSIRECALNPEDFGFEPVEASQNRRITPCRGGAPARDAHGRFVPSKAKRRRR